MTNMLDSGVQSMMTSLLNVAGSSFTYARGAISGAVTMLRQNYPTSYYDINGALVTVETAHFKAVPTSLPVDLPEPGDRIISGNSTWEVGLFGAEKCYRQINDNMIRITARLLS